MTRPNVLFIIMASLFSVFAHAAEPAFLVGLVDSVWIPVGESVDVKIEGKQVYHATLEPSLENCSWQFRLPKIEPGQYRVSFETILAAPEPKNVDIVSGSNVITFPPKKTLTLTPKSSLAEWDNTQKEAEPGTVIMLEPGEYLDPVQVWRNKQIVIRGKATKTHIRSTQAIAYKPDDDQQNGKALWVMAGNYQRIEDIEMSGARVPDKNGAALRIEGKHIDICGAHIHHNENGILGQADNLHVRHTEVAHNGLSEDGQTHNIYLVGGTSFTLQFSYLHHAHIGHNLKSRAERTYVLYNRIMDEQDGSGSYAVDIPNGGVAELIGNLIQQGPQTDNSAIISYGTEGVNENRKNHLRLIHNTVVNDLGKGDFVQLKDGAIETLNNLVVGDGTWITDDPEDVGDYIDEDGDALTNREQFNYSLNIVSGAVGGAIYANKTEALFEYRHPQRGALRDNAQDAGALAFVRQLDD